MRPSWLADQLKLTALNAHALTATNNKPLMKNSKAKILAAYEAVAKYASMVQIDRENGTGNRRTMEEERLNQALSELAKLKEAK
jgi:hypothetical protein